MILTSSFWPEENANPSQLRTANFFTKEVTVIGWINGKAVDFPDLTTVSGALFEAVTSQIACPAVLAALNVGDRHPLQFGGGTEAENEQFMNAFLISQSANQEPPHTLDRSVLATGDFRAFNRTQAVIEPIGNQVLAAQFFNTIAENGDTPDACHSPILTGLGNYIISGGKMLQSEAHPANGAKGVTQDRLHAYHLVEARIGPEGQAVNRTINACFTKDTATGFCINPPGDVTPWIWALTRFDATGQYTVDHQIFPTYYIYENGTFVNAIPQSKLTDFVSKDGQSQLTVADIK